MVVTVPTNATVNLVVTKRPVIVNVISTVVRLVQLMTTAFVMHVMETMCKLSSFLAWST